MAHRLPLVAAAAAGLSLLAAAPASAATVEAHVHRHGEEGPVGKVTFRAAPGEANRLTISGYTFHDSADPVHAKGDCERVDRHTATCPYTEDGADVWLGDRADRARIQGETFLAVHGGPGDDDLRGAFGGDHLLGDGGDDVLRGGRGNDELTGGPGRDRVFGDGGDDRLIDGETDRGSARDLYRGGDSRDTRGADYGDVIDYGRRHRGLRIDLGRHRSNTGDRILGLESIVGGSGDDRLTGDGDDNELLGEGGDDVLRGRAGQDTILGGSGDDREHGDDDADVLWGNTHHDTLWGGGGDDLLESRDHQAESVTCGTGADQVVDNRSDRLASSCEVAVASTAARSLLVGVRPAVSGDAATFRAACVTGLDSSCRVMIAVSGLDGQDYGSSAFTELSDDPDTYTDVVVPLTPAGAAALRAGAVIQVAYGDAGGYRTFVRAG